MSELSGITSSRQLIRERRWTFAALSCTSPQHLIRSRYLFIYVPLSLKRHNQYDDGRAFGMRRHEPETFIERR
jgi:hypothetical protein